MSKYKDVEPRNDDDRVSHKPNADIDLNIALFRKLYLRSEGKLPHGMTVYLSSSTEVENHVVHVGWTPPPNVKMGNYARPISVNQNHKLFEKEFKEVFNYLFNLAKKHQNDNKAEIIKMPEVKINDSNGLKRADPYQGDIKVASEVAKQNLSQYEKEWGYFL